MTKGKNPIKLYAGKFPATPILMTRLKEKTSSGEGNAGRFISILEGKKTKERKKLHPRKSDL